VKTIDLLVEMQSEQRVATTALLTKMDEMKDSLNAHTLEDVNRFNAIEKKLGPVVAMRKMVVRTLVAFILALAAGAGDIACNHLPRILREVPHAAQSTPLP